MAKVALKEELKKIISTAQAELSELEAKEGEERNSDLVGQHFKSWNSYSGKRKNYWWQYFKATAVDKGRISGFWFQRCLVGKIEIEPSVIYGINALSDFQKISREEFEDAWKGLVNEINHRAAEQDIATVQPEPLPQGETKLTRYWVGWRGVNYTEEECTKPPFQVWITGIDTRKKDTDGIRRHHMVALLDAPEEDEVWAAIGKYFPNYERAFCSEEAADFQPEADRFPGFEGRTGLVLRDEGGRMKDEMKIAVEYLDH